MKHIDKATALNLFIARNQINSNPDLRSLVEDILDEVRDKGDEALKTFSRRFDSVSLDSFLVPKSDIEKGYKEIPEELRDAINLSISRVCEFHQHQPKEGFLQPKESSLLGQIVRPLEKVACYIPGGTAPLFSTLIMTAVPAQVAGVDEIVIATPPQKNGNIAPEILATAHMLGINTIYRLGGAQAIAALAYGTESIPKVDKIVGPGNIYVILAKQMLFGEVGIEALPGPTETLILADESASIQHVVADLLAQAEHLAAQPILVTTSQALIDKLTEEVEKQIRDLTTARHAKEALEKRGYVVKVDDLEEGMKVANAYAPEHLCLLVEDPWELLSLVKHAGGVFIGENSMEALGDYIAGPSHVMPTGGTARFSSAINIRDFQKVIPLVSFNQGALTDIAPAAVQMARAEGLEAHARAIESRL